MNESLASEFIQRGCKNCKDAAVAVQVYLELCEVKKFWDVEYFYNAALDKLYFTAKKYKLDKASIFVPIAASEALSFVDLQNLFKLKDAAENQIIYIVIVHSDSTCVYYQIFDGLGEPHALKTAKDDKSQRLDADLKKNRQILEQAALYGIPVTIPKKQKTENAAGSSK